MRELTHLSLFSGIGGLDLAAEWAGFKTVGQCEWADYPTKVLEKHWPDVPRWRDIRTLTGESFYERTGLRTVDIISGGFPCQPFSVAGKQRGKEDDRYLWPEMVRVISELRPAWVVGENVAGIINLALDTVLSDLERQGYTTRTFLIPAAGVGAPHQRYRTAIVGYSKHDGLSATEVTGGAKKAGRGEQKGTKETSESPGAGKSRNIEDVAHSNNTETTRHGEYGREIYTKSESKGFGLCGTYADVSDTENWREQQQIGIREETWRPGSGYWRTTQSCMGGMADGISDWMDGDLDFLINHYWDREPDIPRIANGIQDRVDKLKCLGNAVVPQQFYPVFRSIHEIECMV